MPDMIYDTLGQALLEGLGSRSEQVDKFSSHNAVMRKRDNREVDR